MQAHYCGSMAVTMLCYEVCSNTLLHCIELLVEMHR